MRNAATFIASQSDFSGGLLVNAVRKTQETFQAWKRRRQVAPLMEFDDHMLADIGLTRQDVREALELPFSHDPGRELQVRALHNRPHGWNV